MDKKKVISIVVLIALVASVVFGGYFYYQWSLLKDSPQAVAQREVTDLVEKISKLIVLPVEETPTVATVSDPEALKDQIFFAQAQKGDKVLIYTTAKKAILYSVALGRILEVAPLNIGENQEAVTPPATDDIPTETTE